MNYIERFIKKPKQIPDELFIYDYRTIKNFQKSSGLKDFATALYLALIAEVVFLFCTSNYSGSYDSYILTSSLLSLSESTKIDINVWMKIFYFPIAITLIFVIWRAKNYLLNELLIDIETATDKLFLYLIIPVTFSFIVFMAFSPSFFQFWYLFCSGAFVVTAVISFINSLSFSRGNRYRIRLPKRSDEIHFRKDNRYGFRKQLYKWTLLLLMWFLLTGAFGLILLFISFFLIDYNTRSINNSHMIIFIIINYVYFLLSCIGIHNFTFLSKSVQPRCVEAYEQEIDELFQKMSYSATQNQVPEKKWPLLKMQYRAIQHLRDKDIKPELLVWFKALDKLITNERSN